MHGNRDGSKLEQSESRTNLDFTFETKELRDFCESADLATQNLGEMIARNLRRVLAELAAAESLEIYSQLSAISPNSLSGCFEVNLSKGTKLVARQGHRNPPFNGEGTLELSEVRRIRIVKLELSND